MAPARLGDMAVHTVVCIVLEEFKDWSSLFCSEKQGDLSFQVCEHWEWSPGPVWVSL